MTTEKADRHAWIFHGFAVLHETVRRLRVRAGWMAAVAGDFRFVRSRVLAELAAIFFSSGRDAHAGQVRALPGLLACHEVLL